MTAIISLAIYLVMLAGAFAVHPGAGLLFVGVTLAYLIYGDVWA